MEKFIGDRDTAMAASAKKKNSRWSKPLTRAIKEAGVAEGMSAAKRRELLVEHKNDVEEEDEESEDGGHLKRRRKISRKSKKRRNGVAKNSKGELKIMESATKENEFDEADNMVICDDPEEMSEYDKIRQKNIEERERMFRELQLNESKTRLSDSLNLTKKVKTFASHRGLAAKKAQANEPVRKSLRLQNIEAETGLKLPDKEPTMMHWTPQVVSRPAFDFSS